MTLRMGEHLGPERVRLGVRLVGAPPQRMTPARRRLIEILVGRAAARQIRASRRKPACSAGVIDGLVDEGTLAVEPMPRAAAAAGARSDLRRAGFLAGAARCRRARCARWLRPAVFRWRCSTASPAPARPKCISRRSPRCMRRGEQMLILMPEIALTGQFLDRFAARFGVRPLEWHSELTPRTRARNWAAIAAGEARGRGRRALGAVSALRRSRPDHRR